MKEFICCLWIMIRFAGVFCSPRRVFLDRNCGGSLSLSQERNGVIKLVLTSNKTYAPYTDCHISVVTQHQHMRISTTFLDMDIKSFDSCFGDYLQIYDGIDITDTTFLFTSPHQQKTFCGFRQPPHLSSNHSNITLRFVSDAYFSGKGFSLLLTAFHTGSCRDDEYRCSNSKCIHDSLYCDEYDNCGDESDLCQISVYLIIGIVVTAFITLIAMLFLFSVLHYRFKKRYMEDYDNDFDVVSPLGREYQGCPEVNTGRTLTNTISIITRSLHGNNPGNDNTTEANTATRSCWVNQPLPF